MNLNQTFLRVMNRTWLAAVGLSLCLAACSDTPSEDNSKAQRIRKVRSAPKPVPAQPAAPATKGSPASRRSASTSVAAHDESIFSSSYRQISYTVVSESGESAAGPGLVFNGVLEEYADILCFDDVVFRKNP